jgi:uncharacterized protein (TIGR03118 family)
MSFRQTNLVSDIEGTAPVTDPQLQNPWGIVIYDDQLWVTVNGTSTLSTYDENGNKLGSFPLPDGPSGLALIPNAKPGGDVLVFVTESGAVGVYNPSLLNPIVVKYVDQTSVYKGVAVQGGLVYVANFTKFRVDVFDLVTFTLIGALAIVDSALAAANYGPFNVYSDGKILFISYALVNGHDDQAGPGNGYLNAVYRGSLVRLANRGVLNAPWGMFRKGALLYVGNFGNGLINTFGLTKRNVDDGCSKTLVAESCEPIDNACGTPIQIDGLWGITLYDGSIWFAAGVQDEAHGLVGVLMPNSDDDC